MKHLPLLVCAVVLFLVTSTVAPWHADAQVKGPRRGGTFILSLTGNPPTLNPDITFSSWTIEVAGQIFEGLIWWEESIDKPKPELAESWEVSGDGLTFTFKLRKGVLFHDGTPLTSADVKFTLEGIVKPFHPLGARIMGSVKSIETPDDHTVVVKMEKPNPAFLFYMGEPYVSVQRKRVFEGTDILKNPANLEPVGTGPFKLAEWDKASHITLVRNEKYWRNGVDGKPMPYLDKIIYILVKDTATMISAFEKGEIHAITASAFPQDQVGSLAKVRDAKVVDMKNDPFASVWFLQFNLRHAWLGKQGVRQAIAYALGQETGGDIVKLVYGGLYGKPAISVIPPSLREHNPDVPKYSRDLTKANELLEAAGAKKDADGIRFKLRLNYDANRPYHKPWSEIIKGTLKDVGIAVDFLGIDHATWEVKIYTQHDFDLNIQGFVTGPDPNIGTGRFIHSKQVGTKPFTNAMGYNNSRVDELYDKSAFEPDPKKRQDMYNEIQTILMTEIPILPLIETAVTVVVNEKKIVGWPIGSVYADNVGMNEVWSVGGNLIEALVPTPAPTPTVTRTVTVTTAPEKAVQAVSVDYTSTILAAAVILAIGIGSGAFILARARKRRIA